MEKERKPAKGHEVVKDKCDRGGVCGRSDGASVLPAQTEVKEVIQKKARAKCLWRCSSFASITLIPTLRSTTRRSFVFRLQLAGMSRDAASLPEALLEWVEASVDALAVMRKEGNIKRDMKGREALCLNDGEWACRTFCRGPPPWRNVDASAFPICRTYGGLVRREAG